MAGKSIFNGPPPDDPRDRDSFDDLPSDDLTAGYSAEFLERPLDDDPPRGVGTAEGVRVIGPSEAAEAVERGAVARRKAEREPRLGDRPEVPPVGKAAIRFPLAEDDDPASIERPRPVTAEPSDRLSSVSDATGQHPVLDVGQPTGEVEMPHWTSNATGEVPRVVIGDAPVADDSQSWTSYASGAPQWRDQSSGWDEPSFADLAADLADDGSVNVGALTPQPYEDEDTLTHDEYLGFDDLEVPAAEAPLADLSRVTARGTAADPIRIGSADLGVAPNDRDAESRSNAPMYRPPAGQGTTGTKADDGGAAGGGGRDIRAAAQYGAAIAVVSAVCFIISPLTTALLITVILFVSVGEFFSAVKKLGFAPLAPVGLAAAAALPLAVFAKGEAGVPLVLFLTLLVGVIWYIFGVADEHPLANLGITMLGTVYVGVFGSFAALMLNSFKTIPGVPGEQGTSVLLLAVFAAVAYDIGGLFGGRRFGRRPLSKASPNKTVEGLLCGCGASFVTVFLAGMIWGPLSGANLIIVALAAAAIAPIGDLAESAMKRDLGIKDFSNLIPGHGGVLDRFDSLLFVLPAVYYATRAVLDLG